MFLPLPTGHRKTIWRPQLREGRKLCCGVQPLAGALGSSSYDDKLLLLRPLSLAGEQSCIAPADVRDQLTVICCPMVSSDPELSPKGRPVFC